MKRIELTGLGIAIALAVSGCHQTTGNQRSQPGTVPPPPPMQCDAEDARWSLGEHATERVAERARMASGARSVRVVRPDEAYTMEYDANRLNLEVDDGDVIRDVRCG